MTLSGSLIAFGAALSLSWIAPAAARTAPVIFQPASAAIAPRVIAPTSAVFSRPVSSLSGSGARALPRAKRYRDRWAAGSVGRIGRLPAHEPALVAPAARPLPRR